MSFTADDKNINRNGRPKGSKNLLNHELKSLLVSVFNHNLDEILAQQEKLSLNQRLMLNRTLLPYVLPIIKHEPYHNNLEPSAFDSLKW